MSASGKRNQIATSHTDVMNSVVVFEAKAAQTTHAPDGLASTRCEDEKELREGRVAAS